MLLLWSPAPTTTGNNVTNTVPSRCHIQEKAIQQQYSPSGKQMLSNQQLVTPNIVKRFWKVFTIYLYEYAPHGFDKWRQYHYNLTLTRCLPTHYHKKKCIRTGYPPLLCRLNVDGVHDALDCFCDLLGPDSVLLKLCFHCWLRDTLLRGHNTQVTVTGLGGCCWIGWVNPHATRDKHGTR